MAKSSLKKQHLVTKLNSLNEMHSKEMTMQELRLFSIYLSRINPMDRSTRFVRFPMADFQAIMELSQIKIPYFKKVAESLLRKTVFVPLDSGGFNAFTLFTRVKVNADEYGEWYVEINANEEAMPLLFDYKSHFFKYELWNALRLKGKNQLRLYEILKQYEKIGYRIISVSNLKRVLGLDENDYQHFKGFRQDVLETCRKAIAENTDISFTYEPYSKKRRKIHELKFTITKNKEYKDPLSLEKFIDLKSREQEEPDNVIDAVYSHENDAVDENGFVRATGTTQAYEERIELLMEACNNEFNREEIIVLYNDIREFVPHVCHDELKCYEYLFKKYHLMEMKSKKVKITSRFNYLRKIVGIVEA